MDNNISLMVTDGHGTGLSLGYGDKNFGLYPVEPEKAGAESPLASDHGAAKSGEDRISQDDEITFLGLVREYYPAIVKAFLSGQGSFKNTMQSINYPKIFSYLTHLWSSRQLDEKISKALGPYRLSLEDCILRRMTSEETEELSLINTNLKKMINTPSMQLQEFVRDGIIMLATFAEAREDNTGGHVFRIRESTREICEGLDLPSQEIEDISFSSMMHDIGKIQIPDAILLKGGPLKDEEKIIMQGHCEIGERMLIDKPVYKTAREITRSHHESWDGTGYPDGLKGDSIPLAARITAIADSFDALTHERSYKKTWPAKMAIREMKARSGRQFDPDILEVFIKIQSGEINKGHALKDISEDLM